MEMDNYSKEFLANMLEGENYQPPVHCERAFSENFSEAINIEWSEYEDHLEAIFYKENLEHIAVFSRDGILQEYRKTLPEGYLPYNVRREMDQRGEIMNRVLINKGFTIQYEVILRDKDNNRHLILLSDLGTVIKERVM